MEEIIENPSCSGEINSCFFENENNIDVPFTVPMVEENDPDVPSSSTNKIHGRRKEALKKTVNGNAKRCRNYRLRKKLAEETRVKKLRALVVHEENSVEPVIKMEKYSTQMCQDYRMQESIAEATEDQNNQNINPPVMHEENYPKPASRKVMTVAERSRDYRLRRSVAKATQIYADNSPSPGPSLDSEEELLLHETPVKEKEFGYNDEKNKINMSELNTLLNDLNSLDYLQGKFVDKKTAARLIESFVNINTQEETLIVKSCCLITVLMNKQKIQLSRDQFKKLIEWQLKCLNFNFSATACDILMSMHALFRNHQNFGTQYWDVLLSPDGLLLSYLSSDSKCIEKYDANSMEEIIISIVLCIDSLLSPLESMETDNQIEDLLSLIGGKILAILYSDKINFNRSAHHLNFMTTSLKIFHIIASENSDWCDTNIGELLGLSKTYMHYGIHGIPQTQPQKVHISQQSIVDQGAIEANNRGGKVAKTRKPRTANKNRKSEAKSKQNPINDKSILQLPSGSNIKVDFEIPAFNKTSDSDFSESEASRTRNERHKQAKLRLAAISLIGVIAKNVERRIFYGYWHSLFPNDASAGLLTCSARDPNPRCRVAALQATSVILFGSRSFLLQAEWSEKPPTTFMPFSISLANMIIAMYEVLTQALANESALPVLTQILKCLTVLIQATPFHRLKPGLVTEFVKSIRKLVYHKDPTVQVAALMVMEFLISTPDITTEISDIVGIPKTLIGTMNRNQNRLNDSGVEEVIDTDLAEETLDSDSEDLLASPGVISNSNSAEVNSNNNSETIFKMSWLLQRVLENLGVLVTESKEKIPASTTPVRTECLQVLSSMALHFTLLKDHLQFIALALKSSMNDIQADVRLYTAKCLDSLGHSMNTYLLEHGSPSSDELTSCQNFWISMLPSVIEKIQDAEQSPAIKAILCDFMSNIGVHVFERLSHAYHIQLIGLLSGAGCNEESTVRAAALRALAVYVLFPSLRENLVFVENTAESILHLIKDSNLFVRVRASWSMGNVSDALITNFFNSRVERISEDLLKRLLETAIESASDNDKVRSNAVRTLGNLLRLITADHLKKPIWRSLVQKSVEKLVNCVNTGGNAKVKWNSCYAIGNFMKNSNLFNAQYSDMNWPNLVFPSLCNLIVNHNNFKVRINGTAALITIQDRQNYGTRLQLVWTALLNAMEQSSNLTDFNEYKHRDNLQEQLCIAISHIICISTDEDLNMLKTQLVPKLETIKQIWNRVVSRILPENASPLLSCSLKLQEKLIKNELASEQRNAIQILSSCFTQPSVDLF